MAATESRLAKAWLAAASVTDPELPVLTLVDLGVLRSVDEEPNGGITVIITPTYSGCPAMATMRADLQRALADAGFTDVTIRTVLAPAWSSDWISADGRQKLADYGIAPPGPAPKGSGPIPLTLTPRMPVVCCPLCGSTETELTAEFGATSCKSQHRCMSCAEPFERIKEI